MGYRAYPEYKESGVEWLGKIPSHWDQCPVKRKFLIANGSTPKSGEPEFWDGETLWITPADFSRASSGYLNESGRTITDAGLASCGTRLVPSNSIVISVRAPIGEIIQAASELCTNQGCKSLIKDTSEVHERFFFYVLSCSSKQLNALGLGTTFMELSTHGLGQYRVPLPPQKEQERIAQFLDHKTAHIDRLIEKKQELIEKLQEQRSSIITMAVTRGINAQALTGPCDQDWLGGVPEHWEKNYKLNFLTTDDRNSFVNGPFGSDLLTSELVNEGVPVIYSGDVKEIGFQRKSDKYVTEEKAKQLDFCRLDGGDILLAKVGDPPGDACVYPLGQPSGIVTQDVVRIKVDKRTVDAEYLCFLLNSKYGRHLVRLVSVEATRGRFSLADLKSIRHILPPLEEQQEIVLHIQQQMKRCNRLSDLAIREIDALQEYRTALITAAVTGQIDVRDWQAPEPIQEPEADKEVA